VNYALNRPATASSVEPATSFTPGLATDGNGGTRWSSAHSDPQWIQVDLGQVRPVNRVRLSWETAFARGYQVQASYDGSTWTTLFATTIGDGGIDDLTGLNGSGRYVRVLGTVRGTQWGYSLWELEVG
jgi:hexosaminidase